MAGDIDDIRQELAATQYWLMRLFVITSSPKRYVSDARAIRQHIFDLKNVSPTPRMSAAGYDEMALKRMPHVEKIGNWIADLMDPPA
jgi:hypothetical protein